MKRILFTAVAALCLLVAGKGLAQQCRLQAQIPFDFCVGDHVLPAGTYTVAPYEHPWVPAIMVRNTVTGEAVLNRTISDSYHPAEFPARLIFHRYGEQYFLREVHGSFAANNVLLPVSRREKRAQEEMGTVKVYEHITVPTEKD